MTVKRREQIRALLKSIETGDAASIAVVSTEQYIQHNPQTQEGGEGLAALFKRLSAMSPRVNIVRAFSDGDYVFAHTEYDFGSPRVGFEIFRFEGDVTVEHWDNIQPREGPNLSGHTMVDGPTEATDLDKTEANREFVCSFVQDILIDERLDRVKQYLDAEGFIEHDPRIGGDSPAQHPALSGPGSGDGVTIRRDRLHRVLAEGSFVLSVSEGVRDGIHSSFYDLYRIRRSRIVEHWNTVEKIPPRNQWKNDNGKF